MRWQRCLASVAVIAPGVRSFAATSSKYDVGFLGYGITVYEPFCAFPCIYALFSARLNCTTAELALTKRDDAVEPEVLPYGDGWNVTDSATDACTSHNEYYMTTAAWCVKSRCPELSPADLEKFYADQFPGEIKSDLPSPFHTFDELLSSIPNAPTEAFNLTKTLNYTASIPDEMYVPVYETMRAFAKTEYDHSMYSMIIFISGLVIPIGLSLLRFFPWPTAWQTKFNAYFIDPPLVGTKHTTPIWGLGMVPTRGQSIFIAYMWIVNIVATSHGIHLSWPTPWYDNKYGAVMLFVANRCGVLSCAQLPLLILYAGRNNLLLWLTNWKHSTFLLLHRWTAFLCMLHAVLHSLLYTEIAVKGWEGFVFSVESTQMYWYIGIIATLAMVILCTISVQRVRQKAYEFFLASHILFSVMAIVATFYHINLKYEHDYGFENWLYMASAIWIFDRAIRLARSLCHGVKRAYLTPVDEDYYRLDIPGMTASGHVYLHFPSVSLWRIWENHPFSVATVTYRKVGSSARLPQPQPEITGDMEKSVQGSSNDTRSSSSVSSDTDGVEQTQKSGVVLFVRKHGGLTSLLSRKLMSTRGIPVLVEGSYGTAGSFMQDGHPTPTHQYPNLICIAGGVGITGVLPALDHFNVTGRPLGQRKLYWGVRTMPLVHSVEGMLGYDCGNAMERSWGDVGVTLSVGLRLNLRMILDSELRQQEGGTTVVVCGPAGMADDVRYIVSALGRHSGDNGPILVKLVVENFTW